jgi:hypothetical protein
MSPNLVDTTAYGNGPIARQGNQNEQEAMNAATAAIYCRNKKPAFSVIGERRRFEDLVSLVKELF